MNVSGEPLERNEVHFLKILPQYFKEVLAGKKTFELRKDDRNYKVNDAIILREFDGGNYTGRKLFTYITYILRNAPQYGLMDGYCIFGLETDKNLRISWVLPDENIERNKNNG